MSVYKDFTDTELVAEIAKFKSRALEELYDRYSAIVFTLAKKIAPDEMTAEGIVVDVFALIWKHADKIIASGSCVYAWIISLARNKAIDTLKRSRSAVATLDYYDEDYEEEFIIPLISDAIDKIDLKDAMRYKDHMEEALDRLTDVQKYVIHLAFYEGYNINEISERLGLPKEALRTKIYTALNTLNENFHAESK